MDTSEDLPRIHSDDDWLELGHGEKGIVRKRLEAIINPTKPTAILVRSADWDIMSIEIDQDGNGIQWHNAVEALKEIPIGTDIELVIHRGENGPCATLTAVAGIKVLV